MRSPNDYALMEQEFIQSDISIRALAEKHGVSFSAVATQGRKREWARKREDFRSKVSDRQMTIAANKIGDKIEAIREDALTVIQAAIMKMGMDLRDRVVKDYDVVTHQAYERVIPAIQVTPSDVTKLIASFQTLIGQASTITENRNLGISLTPDLPPDIARAIADLAAERGSDRGPVGRAALPSSGSTRSH